MFAQHIIFLVLLINYSTPKENAVYQVSGIQIIDLIRGFKPKEMLKLTKVEGGPSSLPDGIYFEPEDDALMPEEMKFLYLNGQETKTNSKKLDGITTDD
ncbi:unnamed protein product [Arctia plantaginis]|uniref:Uncharacterized protein n=1 Tax=Arctia plantaginis TaxID=874455 RepID=A0A8S0ZXY5_ARCPL|nr:unnamed protein product [Arctia plantaginis]